MPATKNINQQIETAQERIRQEQNRLKQLQGKQKEYERKARSHRLCKRHGILESMLPDLISITDEQYHTFLERAVANDYGRSVLAKIIVQGVNETSQKAPAGVGHNGSESAQVERHPSDKTPSAGSGSVVQGS